MILITGGSGFIGRHLVAMLRKERLPFKVLIHRRKANELLPEECVYGDVSKRQSIRKVFKKYSLVLHLADGYSERLHVSGTENLLEVCREFGVGRFIFMSSIDVITSPETSYSQSKRLAEDKVRSSGLESCIVRPSMVYGPGDRYISTLIRWNKRYSVVLMPGDGRELRRPLYVGDLISRLLPLLFDKDIPASVNIAGRDVMSIREMSAAVQEHLGVKRIYLKIPGIFLKTGGVFSRRLRFIEENMIDKHAIRTDEDVLLADTTFSDGLVKMLAT